MKSNRTNKNAWQNFREFYFDFPAIELAVDLSRMGIKKEYFSKMESRIQRAFKAMTALEKGAIANPDENRMVGHYWLRNSRIAPNRSIQREIEANLKNIKAFTKKVHAGRIKGSGGTFRNLLIIGIGGSALGPQFVSQALGNPRTDKLHPYFLDNTDPDGMQRVFGKIGNDLSKTLCVVISKSGGTKETRNGMLEAKAAYEKRRLHFEAHAVAITGVGSELDNYAKSNRWIRRFPMWDWVGGRTSELSGVGLLPATLQAIETDELLRGARECDAVTRSPVTRKNPAALLALSWYHAVGGVGEKNMVVLPYKDRLELLSKYLQQLIMESLGKEKDLTGKVVNQGITVLGNKGSTDQHSYIQQLRDGLDDFFVTFIEVLVDQKRPGVFVEPGITSGDYLSGFLLGTRQALHEARRLSLCLTVRDVSPFSVGVLIALYERAVGFYASLVNINAYHQPGVEAGKKAAANVLVLQKRIVTHLKSNKGKTFTAEAIANAIASPDQTEHVFKICQRLAMNPWRRIKKETNTNPLDSRFHAA
ncbi:MAG TPA: glucose-6-phosphate isomerase [Verrucomicrobiae bacterium]|nr:glucose-6-phosphate isomerase [Verrucomicrobiae bacterium]